MTMKKLPVLLYEESAVAQRAAAILRQKGIECELLRATVNTPEGGERELCSVFVNDQEYRAASAAIKAAQTETDTPHDEPSWGWTYATGETATQNKPSRNREKLKKWSMAAGFLLIAALFIFLAKKYEPTAQPDAAPVYEVSDVVASETPETDETPETEETPDEYDLDEGNIIKEVHYHDVCGVSVPYYTYRYVPSTSYRIKQREMYESIAEKHQKLFEEMKNRKPIIAPTPPRRFTMPNLAPRDTTTVFPHVPHVSSESHRVIPESPVSGGSNAVDTTGSGG